MSKKQKKIDKLMIQTAEIWSQMSYCKRSQVGAVLAKDSRILATGYNGTISGQVNICEEYEKIKTNFKQFKVDINDDLLIDCPDCNGTGEMEIGNYYGHIVTDECPTCNGFGKLKIKNKTSEFTLHAEQNVITFCAKNGISTKGTTLYITMSPCPNCAKLIAQSGIKRVVYKDTYRDKSGIEFLKKCNVEVEQLENVDEY